MDLQQMVAQASILEKRGDVEGALQLYRNQMEKHPFQDMILYNLGVLEDKRGSMDQAVAYFEKALAVNSANIPALLALQVMRFRVGRLDESQELVLQILHKYPTEIPLAHHNLGAILEAKGDFIGAEKAFLTAISLNPNYVPSHYGLAFVYGRSGDLQRCWKKMLDAFCRKSPACPNKGIPWWKGEDITGKSIVVYPNGGIGDYFQFFRYLEILSEKNVTIFLEGYPRSLMGDLLLRSLPKNIGMYTPEQSFDFPCLISHLGILCNTTLDTIPIKIPYLQPHPYKVNDWKKYFSKYKSYKVGLVWKGDPQRMNDQYRSMSLVDFSPFSNIKNCTFYGLQKNNTEVAPEGLPFVDLSSKLHTFDDTAAIISCLDLVIGVDTAVIHLAGALGKPVWTLIGFCSDYRWMLQREDTPWYPTMRIFRSKGIYEWKEVVASIQRCLEVEVASKGSYF